MTPNPNDPNITMLDRVAQRLGPELCSSMVFVGGAAAGLLITDLALPTIRRTDDVDVVSPAQALEEFHHGVSLSPGSWARSGEKKACRDCRLLEQSQ